MSDAMITVTDSTGSYKIRPDSMPQTLTYDGSGNLSTVSVTDGSNTWTQTLTYNGSGDLTGVSAWVKQ